LKTKQLERPEKIQKIKIKRFIYFLFLLFGRKTIWPYQSTFTVGLVLVLTFLLLLKKKSGTKNTKPIGLV